MFRTSSEEESSNESGADSESESSQHRENDQESKRCVIRTLRTFMCKSLELRLRTYAGRLVSFVFNRLQCWKLTKTLFIANF